MTDAVHSGVLLPQDQRSEPGSLSRSSAGPLLHSCDLQDGQRFAGDVGRAEASPGQGALEADVRIVYSSRTGNTRRVAAHLAERFCIPAMSVQEAVCRWGAHAERRRERMAGPLGEEDTLPSACGLAMPKTRLLVLGFWMWRGGPDGAMLGFMRRLQGRDVFVFGTMAAWPDSGHAQKALVRIRRILDEGGNSLAGHFFCQGGLDPAVLARSHHPMTPERKLRLEEAAKHPDASDLIRAEAALRLVLER